MGLGLAQGLPHEAHPEFLTLLRDKGQGYSGKAGGQTRVRSSEVRRAFAIDTVPIYSPPPTSLQSGEGFVQVLGPLALTSNLLLWPPVGFESQLGVGLGDTAAEAALGVNDLRGAPS